MIRSGPLREQIPHFWASLCLICSYKAPTEFLRKLLSPHLLPAPKRSCKHTSRACTNGTLVIAARFFFSLRSLGTISVGKKHVCLVQKKGCGVSSSPPCCRCLRWRPVCLDCAQWLEEYVASTECGGSVFPGWKTDGREKSKSCKPLLGTRYQTPFKLDLRLARFQPAKLWRHQHRRQRRKSKINLKDEKRTLEVTVRLQRRKNHLAETKLLTLGLYLSHT